MKMLFTRNNRAPRSGKPSMTVTLWQSGELARHYLIECVTRDHNGAMECVELTAYNDERSAAAHYLDVANDL